MDYRVKKVGDGWEFLTKKELDEKLGYERLLNNINRREKKIESDLDKIKKLKEELREMKKKRTLQHHQLLKYHKEFSPTFSVSMSKNKKLRGGDSNEGMFHTTGNRSWTIYVRVSGKRKPIYLGTQLKVNEMLDLIEGKSDYYINLHPHKRPKHEERIKNKIEKIVYPLIKRDMLECLDKEGKMDSFIDSTIKGMKYLKELYLNSGFYEERVPMDPKFKGKFTTYNPMFLKKK